MQRPRRSAVELGALEIVAEAWAAIGQILALAVVRLVVVRVGRHDLAAGRDAGAGVDGDLRYWATVRGKDTRAETSGKRERKAWGPKDVWRDLRLQIQDHDLEGPTRCFRAGKAGTSRHSPGAGS